MRLFSLHRPSFQDGFGIAAEQQLCCPQAEFAFQMLRTLPQLGGADTDVMGVACDNGNQVLLQKLLFWYLPVP